MTNLEWLLSLSVEEIEKRYYGDECTRCIYDNSRECDNRSCAEGTLKWLNEEHIPKLKPCPFCGAECDFINRDSNVFWVQCGNCGSHGTQSRTQRAAVEAWNRRVNDELER